MCLAMARHNLVTKQCCPPNLVPAVTVLKEPQRTPMAEASRRHAERWQQQVMGCASNDTQRGLYRASSLETRNTWSAASSLETHTVMCAALSFSSRTLRLVRARILVQPSAALRLASGRNCSPYLLILLLLLLDACFVLAPVVPLDRHWRRLARYVGVHLRG